MRIICLALRECPGIICEGEFSMGLLVRYEGDNFVLDQQVVRAALKSYKAFTSEAVTELSPSTHYLRLLRENQPSPNTLVRDGTPESYILLLEWRAALMVRERSMHQQETDTNVDQRVAKAVTEAFVANQVGDMIKNSSLHGERDTKVLRDLYTLVSFLSSLLMLISKG